MILAPILKPIQRKSACGYRLIEHNSVANKACSCLFPQIPQIETAEDQQNVGPLSCGGGEIIDPVHRVLPKQRPMIYFTPHITSGQKKCSGRNHVLFLPL